MNLIRIVVVVGKIGCFVLFAQVFALGQGLDSLFMRKLGQWDDDNLPSVGGFQFNDVWGYTADDREYAIIGHIDSIFIIDVTDSPQLTQVFSYYGGSRTYWRDFKIFQDRLYAVSDNSSEGLLVFDLSCLPDTIKKVSRFTGDFSSSHNIFIDTSSAHLYAAGTNTRRHGLIIFDLAPDPDTPLLVKSLDFRDVLEDYSKSYYVHDVFVQNDTAYCSHGYTGYYIWDLTDPENATLLGNYDPVGSGYNHSSWITQDGNYVVYAEEIPAGRPLSIIDISDMGSMQEVAIYKEPLLGPEYANNIPHNPYVKGNYVYSSFYEDGVVVVDISDINDPQRSAFYDTNPENIQYNGYNNCWGVYPFLPSGKILASDMENGLFVLEVDFSIPIIYYADQDGDGYGNPADMLESFELTAPEGYVLDQSDCDDTDPESYPGAPEACNNKDNNCNDLIDDNCDPCLTMPESIAVDDVPISNGVHQAIDTVSSKGMVENGSSVIFKSGQVIVLDESFSVEQLANFKALIEPCGQILQISPQPPYIMQARKKGTGYFPIAPVRE